MPSALAEACLSQNALQPLGSFMPLRRLCAAACFLLAALSIAAAQESPQEMTSSAAPITFKAGAKEVLVRVVVRDGNGKAVGNLAREDFRVYDKSALQKLTSF